MAKHHRPVMAEAETVAYTGWMAETWWIRDNTDWGYDCKGLDTHLVQQA